MKKALARLSAIGAVAGAFMVTLVQSVHAQYTAPDAATLTTIQNEITSGVSDFTTYILAFIGVFVAIFFGKKVISFIRGLLKMR